MTTEQFQTVADTRTIEKHTERMVPASHADPGGLFAQLKADPKVTIASLDAGPERVVLVLQSALAGNYYDEEYRSPGNRRHYPVMVVRERPASEIGKPDNASTWTTLGVFRHVQCLDGATLEYVEHGKRLLRDNGTRATVVLRTTGTVRTFSHEDDQSVTEKTAIPC